MARAVVIDAPARWDKPFGPRMTNAAVGEVLARPPFDSMDPRSFSAPLTLTAIIRNDARLLQVNPGAILVREGDFGTSVFFVLEGQVRVAQGKALMEEARGGAQAPRRNLRSAMSQLWRNHKVPEVRDISLRAAATRVEFDTPEDTEQRLYFTNVQDVIARYPGAVALGAGDIFGESSALGRSPRSATVFAEGPARLLEMRWQGFRDILRRNPELREQVNDIYRQRALINHLQASPLFDHLSDDELEAVAGRTLFESYGDYDWHIGFKRLKSGGERYSTESEPIIAEQGNYADGLIVMCAGFARTDVRVDHGYHTVSYLRPGDAFGIEELAHNWRNHESDPLPLQRSLRAVGYAHVLRIPSDIVERYLLQHVDASRLSEPVALRSFSAIGAGQDAGLDQATLEFLVDQRIINGTATMLIDLDRCTRCDDCVRACASTHDNNARFVRHGPVFDHFMVANACMHCSDPVCMIGCPTGAIQRHTDAGQVVIDDTTCIGCATCANSCPYDNIRMVRVRDEQNTQILNQKTFAPVLRATKCDLCAEQMARLAPACQNACPHDALVRIDMSDNKALTAYLNR